MDNLFANLPLEIIHHVLTFDRRFVLRNGKLEQINLISKEDKRYDMLREIPSKVFDPNDGTTYVYLNIDDEKDIYIVHVPNYNCIQYQILGYDENIVYHIDGHTHIY